MTAEIAILNRHAVAMAADSAVTVGGPRTQKIFNTVNKLFMLSKHAPVGVMVFGDAELTGMPWETVVKEFREDLGRKRFATLEAYAAALTTFLERQRTLFSRDQQSLEITRRAIEPFLRIKRRTTDELNAAFTPNASVSDHQVRAIVRKHIRAQAAELNAQKDLSGYPTSHRAQVRRSFVRDVDLAINQVFEKLPLLKVDRQNLHDIAALFMTKDYFPIPSSGLVIAGFGDRDHFPGLIEFDVHSVVLGRVKQRKIGEARVSARNSATIYPFAQREMVDLFMEGIAPPFEREIEKALATFLQGLPGEVVKKLPLSPKQKQAFETEMRPAGRDILKKFRERMTQYERANHVDPIVEAVALLPKEGLAEMAESLVNLTSFKRRVTMDPETVGGPIDVAVISKGDGFIWIKRKHYFKPDLNHQFFTNYFKE